MGVGYVNPDKPGALRHQIRRNYRERDDKDPLLEVQIKAPGPLRGRVSDWGDGSLKSLRPEGRFESRAPSLEAVRLVESIGSISLKKALGLLKPRYGRSVVSESVKREFDRGDDEAQDIIRDAYAAISGQKAEKDAGRHWFQGRRIGPPAVLYRKEHILRALRDAGKRSFTACELAAAVAYENGLSGDGYVEHLNAVRALKQNDGFEVVSGNMSDYAQIVRDGILEGMHRLLWKPGSGKKMFSTDEIADKMGLYQYLGEEYRRRHLDPKDGSNSKRIRQTASKYLTTAGGVLESMGLVKKYPMPTSEGSSLRWVHVGHIHSVYLPPRECIDYDILSHLFENGETSIDHFTAHENIKDSNIGSIEGRYNSAVVLKAVDRLETDGVVVKRKTGQKNYVALTGEGQDIMRAQALFDLDCEIHGRVPQLLEDTRRMLLGTHSQGLGAAEVKTLGRICAGVALLRRLEAPERIQLLEEIRRMPPEDAPKMKYGAVYARLIDEVDEMGLGLERQKLERLAYNLAYGERPWTNISEHNLREKYHPALVSLEAEGRVEEGAAAWFMENVVKAKAP
ncbi:MAG: hypothetical protein V1875_05645 [Candidatus Altiarchaeota archaeon]